MHCDYNFSGTVIAEYVALEHPQVIHFQQFALRENYMMGKIDYKEDIMPSYCVRRERRYNPSIPLFSETWRHKTVKFSMRYVTFLEAMNDVGFTALAFSVQPDVPHPNNIIVHQQ